MVAARGTAARGAIGGSSGDAGVEYRRAVAAYAATCGLAGVPLPGLDIVAADAHVAAVILETDAAVDDIGIEFTSTWTADVQAKRTLRKGAVFEKAVEQWANAAIQGFDPTRHRLVIAAGRLSEPMRALRQALNRRRLHSPGGATKAESEMLTYLEGLLGDLTEEQRNSVLDAAVIWEIAVEEPDDASAREALAHLNSAGVGLASGQGGNAWTRLCATAGRLARRRGGYDLAGWLNELRGQGLLVNPTAGSPAAVLEQQRAAFERYARRLVREASELDLRALGAQLPPLAVETADARVQVSIPPEDRRGRTELIWAFLRRHRVVLTGLPGAGKSTALRRAAGQLAERLLEEMLGEQPGDPSYPFPVRASLKDINALDESPSFRDRMVAVAIRLDSPGDRELLRSEIERRLGSGLPIALFLDALDETYDDRHRVVSEVESFLAGLPDSACVLIATRDIAYGQAATLGWEDLRLVAPDDVDAVVNAILQAAAAHQGVPASQAASWRRSRREWVNRVLAQDSALRETPLIPTLLALLTIERPPDRLPTKRAEVLQAVVTNVMERHEAPRQDGGPLRNLTGGSLGTWAMHAYATEATVLLDNNGVATIEQVLAAVAERVAEQWGLPPAPASAAALDAVRFLDETGVFVMSEHQGTVTARLSLFAEVGDAINAIQHPDTAEAWVRQRIEDRQLEPVILAAALDERVNRAWQEELADRPGDLELVRAMARARGEGVAFTEETTERMRSELLTSIGRGNRDGWSDWRRLMELGVPPELIGRAVEAASAHSAQHLLVAQAALALQHAAAGGEEAENSVLIDVLTVHNLPKPANETTQRRGVEGLAIDGSLSATQLEAATELLRREVPGALEAILARALDSSSQLSESLVELLKTTGHDEVAKQITTERAERLTSGGFFEALLKNRSADRYPHFLELVAEGDRAELATRQRVELSELGDFLETLDMNDMNVTMLYGRDDDFLRDLIKLTSALFSFDRGVLAAEAQVVLDRLEKDPSLETYFSLFDTAEARDDTDWLAVPDQDAAVDLLAEMLWMGESQAWFVARCLWEAEIVAAKAAPILRDLVTRFAGHPRHQYVVALALASLPGQVDPSEWAASADPVLRRVASNFIEAVVDGRLNEEFRPFLADADGGVRVAAIGELAEVDFSGREALLEELLIQDRPGWRCSSCLTENAAGTSGCATEKCVSAAPDPARTAQKVLERVRRSAPT